MLDQFAGSIGLKGTEHRYTFLIPAFFGQFWNIQHSCMVIDGKVKAFHHTAVHQSVHKEVIPASFLCQQITFKLATAFSFQFQQDTFFFIGRSIYENISDVVVFCITVMPEVLMYHVLDIEL